MNERDLNAEIDHDQIIRDFAQQHKKKKRSRSKRKSHDMANSQSRGHSRKVSSNNKFSSKDPTTEFISSLSKYGIIDHNWKKILNDSDMKKLKKKAEKLYYSHSNLQQLAKGQLVMDL